MKTYKTHHYDELGSTNSFVKSELQNMADHTLIITDYQTKGRGRRNNRWVSDRNTSFLGTFYKNSEEKNAFRFLLEASVALIDTLKAYDIKPFVKPPNDIYVRNDKIAGVLIEIIRESKLHIICGIGLNINESKSDLGISMEAIKGHPLPLREVRHVLKNAFENAETLSQKALFETYKSHIDFKRIQVEKNSNIMTLTDINEDFECQVGNTLEACESLKFTYKL